MKTVYEVYDVVIVGAGIAGCIMAKTLTQAGKKVLLLEAGLHAGIDLGVNNSFNNYMEYLDTFYEAAAKVPNSPYPNLKDAPSSDVINVNDYPNSKGYFVQAGPLPFASDNLRGPGGTTLHWLGSTPRMLPNDFQMQTLYGQGVDWPITYDDLMPYYEMAELEIGVSGSVEEQFGPDVTPSRNYGDGYNFPMEKIPQSHLDNVVMSKFSEEATLKFNGQEHPLAFAPTPQGRNSVPNPDYPYNDVVWEESQQSLILHEHPEEYEPVGAIWDQNNGLRCEGNASCVPICPVQAKYNALKSLRRADFSNLEISTQSVASRVLIDGYSGEVAGIEYKKYDTDDSPAYERKIAKGKIYVLAASAIENAKILLASDNAANSSDQVGRNLMDHMCLLTWGLIQGDKVFPFRGPGSTTNIATMRDGDFRKVHAACICPLDNWGWGWPVFSPGSDLSAAVGGGMFGKDLREYMNNRIPRQILLHFECEMAPEPTNRVTISEDYKDAIGNYRPVLHFDASNYMKRAFATYKKVSDQFFDEAGIEDHTTYSLASNSDYVEYEGKGYNFWGAGHIVGTHRMGSSAEDSVVDENGKTWDHDNLYLIGAGNMPTLGTSNPTLTLTALTYKTAESILQRLSNS